MYTLVAFIALSVILTFVNLRIEQTLVKQVEARAATVEQLAEENVFKTWYWSYRDAGVDENRAFIKSRERYVKSLELPEAVSIIPILIICLTFVLQFYIGKNGRSWVLSDLKRRGFQFQRSIYADNKDAMLAELHQEQSEKSD